MKLFCTILAAVLLTSSSAFGHVLFIMPTTDGSGFDVVYSDSPKPDDKVRLELFETARFEGSDANGSPVAVSTEKPTGGRMHLASSGATISASIAYGVVFRGDPSPILMTFHPKAMRTVAAADAKPIGMPLEITAISENGGMRLFVTESGKPVAKQDVQIFKPGESQPVVVTTDERGRTPAFSQGGHYAARVYRAAADAGEHQGRRYQGARRYATLTVRFDGTP